MSQVLARDQVQRVAGLELNALRLAGVLPESRFEGARVPATGTEVYDPNGELLFHRLPISRRRLPVGFADLAVNDALAEPLLATSYGMEWNEKALLGQAAAAARKGRRSLKYDRARFVAYSYPKVAVQFLLGDQEVLMLELGTWAVVEPSRPTNREPLRPSNFERWSLLDELPAETRTANARAFRKRLQVWEDPKLRRVNPALISVETFARLRDITIKLVDTRELHYSRRDADHQICYELRGQRTNVWCVAASAEMLLNFYRYEFDQVRLAQELGLGTLQNPNGLPYARVGDVVTVIDKLACLDATMITNPGFDVFKNEIAANRPLISFIPGHSRTVAGYTRTLLTIVNQVPYRGLLVYDPWPPNAGVITRWENFNTQTYLFAYSAVLKHV